MLKSIHGIAIKASKIFSRKGLYPFLKAEFNSIQPGSKVLSIGSGGEISRLLKYFSTKNNFEVSFLDFDSSRKPDIVADICVWEPGDYRVDVVVICEVLEHLPSPGAAISNMKRILNKNGKVIGSVPFIFPIHEAPYDFYRYTEYGLKHLLSDFKDVNILSRNSWSEAIVVVALRLIMERGLGPKFLGCIFILCSFIFSPAVYLCGKLAKVRSITTGYNFTCKY